MHFLVMSPCSHDIIVYLILVDYYSTLTFKHLVYAVNHTRPLCDKRLRGEGLAMQD